MPEPWTLDKVLQGAIKKEIESQRLYSDLSGRMKNPAARAAFEDLVVQERGHQEKLEQYRAGKLKGSLSKDHVIDYRIADLVSGPDMSPNMDLKDAFLFAASREKASHELYTGLAVIHPEGEVRTLLLQLANQELEHKQRVESLYTQVAYPQTDGG
jgi:rubrerythrin